MRGLFKALLFFVKSLLTLDKLKLHMDIVRVYETVAQRAKTGTSGYQTEDEFNRDINSVQTELMSIVTPLYDISPAVREILGPFVVPLAGNTDASGMISKPSDYFQIDSLSISGYPVKKISTNERFMLRYVPSRSPSSADGRFFYFLENDEINILPAEAHSVIGTYIRQPNEAEIDFTVTSTDDDDYIVPVSVTDLEWPERAFNLIVALMLQKLGLEQKENLLIEFSNIGISMEMQKLQ